MTLTRINAPVLRAVHFLDLGEVELLALDRQVDRLATGHAERAARLGQQLHQPQRIAGEAGSAGSRVNT